MGVLCGIMGVSLGVIVSSADDDVTVGIGLSEGIEDGIAVLLSGWSPMWAATSAGAIAKLPVLAGIECLTIFADADTPGLKAARACTTRWQESGREAVLVAPDRSART
jgi:hypothetical protein